MRTQKEKGIATKGTKQLPSVLSRSSSLSRLSPSTPQHKFYEYFKVHFGFGWQEHVEWNALESKNACLKMESSGDGFYGYKMHCYLSKVGTGKPASLKTTVLKPGLFEEEPALEKFRVMICPVAGDAFLWPLQAGLGEDHISAAPAGRSGWGPHLNVKSWESTFSNVWEQR